MKIAVIFNDIMVMDVGLPSIKWFIQPSSINNFSNKKWKVCIKEPQKISKLSFCEFSVYVFDLSEL